MLAAQLFQLFFNMFEIFSIKNDKNYISCKNKEMKLAQLYFREVSVRNGCEA